MTIDIPAVQVVAFDLFGTVFSFADVDIDERRAYIAHITKPDYTPLALPDSWLDLPLHPDSLEGIKRLSDKYDLCSCSNAPYEFTQELFLRSGLAGLLEIADVEATMAFKPAPACYESIRHLMDCESGDVLMVTGNRGSKDVDGARAVGMQSILIRQPNTPQTIIELAELLGC